MTMRSQSLCRGTFLDPLAFVCLAVATVLTLGSPTRLEAVESGRRWTLELELEGRRVEGMPLEWSAGEVQLLGRDGRLLSFTPQQAKHARKSAEGFRSFSQAEVRDALLLELGRDFEVSGTGHYLVAHPRGQREQWSQRFEDMYRSFVHYFSVRGFRATEPEFPMIAIVWRNQQDFFRYARSDGAAIGPGVLGYYSPVSNRVTLFDSSGGTAAGDAWQQDVETIVHEVTHQTAFNTGVHRRFSAAPRWLVEGLGTLFESRGVWNSRQYSQFNDRINAGRLTDFRAFVAAGRPVGHLAQVVSSDRIFALSPGAAYGEAWALTFYLVETRPRDYSAYLRKTASRPAFGSYSAAERLSDFTAVFGPDLQLLEAQFLRYMSTEL
jgi:Protein of unknown function (DUF1570)